MESETSHIHPGKERSLAPELDLFPKSLVSVGEEVAWNFTWSPKQKMLGWHRGPARQILEGQVSSLLGGMEPNQTLQGLEHQTTGFAALPQFPPQKGEEVTWQVTTSRFLG